MQINFYKFMSFHVLIPFLRSKYKWQIYIAFRCQCPFSDFFLFYPAPLHPAKIKGYKAYYYMKLTEYSDILTQSSLFLPVSSSKTLSVLWLFILDLIYTYKQKLSRKTFWQGTVPNCHAVPLPIKTIFTSSGLFHGIILSILQQQACKGRFLLPC